MIKNDTSQGCRERLKKRAYEFDFFQAVRLLLLEAGAKGVDDCLCGTDTNPGEEIVRFRALPSHRHSPGEIAGCNHVEHPDDQAENEQLDMSVSFLGLTGPSGVLPRHYTEMMIERVRQSDYALRDFFDLFHHRIISHFFRAWAKYRLPFSYEISQLNDTENEDEISNCLFSLVGLGTGGLRNRLKFDDRSFVFFGGEFAKAVPNVSSLETMLGEQFGVSARIQQFQQEWLYIDPGDQTQIGKPCELGVSTIVGSRVSSIESRIRIQLGPCDLAEFNRFSPMGDRLVPMAQFVRTYVGMDLDFDFQPILKRERVPVSKLGGGASSGTRLGWNSWLHSLPMTEDVSDAVFELDGKPSR